MIDYDNHLIYCIYLKKDVKVIQIKNLKIFKDTSTKIKTSLSIYDAIIYTKSWFIFLQLPQDSFFEPLIIKSSFYTQTRLG